MKQNINFILIKGQSSGLKVFKSSKSFFAYSNDRDDIYKNTEEYNSKRKRKILILFWWYDCWYA